MAFLIDETVIHIKLTDKGRELLSRGELRFKKFAIGDSEIDYNFNSDNNVSSENDNFSLSLITDRNFIMSFFGN